MTQSHLAFKEEKMALYAATKTLDVQYQFNGRGESATVLLPGADNHAILKAGCDELLSEWKGLYEGQKAKVEKVNFATAMVTFLYTDTTLEEGYLGEHVKSSSIFHTVSGSQRIVSSMCLYPPETNYSQAGVSSTKKARNNDFNSSLMKRINSFSAIAGRYYYSPKNIPILNQSQLNTSIRGEMFHEAFHHTEQAIMYSVSSPKGIHSLTTELSKLKAKYLYGVVLDIYTQRMLCCNCNACLLGMQNSCESGFLHDFARALTEQRIAPRTGSQLMLSTRVSASKAPKKATIDPLRLPIDNCKAHSYNPDREMKIFQAENRALGTEAIKHKKGYSLASYQGTFFTSSKQKNKAKLEMKIVFNTQKEHKAFIPEISATTVPALVHPLSEAKYHNDQGMILFNQGKFTEACVHFEVSAMRGNVDAQAQLGYCYLQGLGVVQNNEFGVMWCQKAANQNNVNAQMNLGIYNETVAKDIPNAIAWYRLAANQGDKEAFNSILRLEQVQLQEEARYYYEQGLGAYNQNQPAQAVEYFKRGAEKGNSNAQAWLGYCNYNGIGITRNQENGIYWYHQSARQNHAHAQHFLGNYCETVLKDIKQAIYWYNLAVAQKCTQSYESLVRLNVLPDNTIVNTYSYSKKM